MDESRRLLSSLRLRGSCFAPSDPETQPRPELEPKHLVLLGIVSENPYLEDILEKSPFTDLETCRILDELLRGGVLRGSPFQPPR